MKSTSERRQAHNDLQGRCNEGPFFAPNVLVLMASFGPSACCTSVSSAQGTCTTTTTGCQAWHTWSCKGGTNGRPKSTPGREGWSCIALTTIVTLRLLFLFLFLHTVRDKSTLGPYWYVCSMKCEHSGCPESRKYCRRSERGTATSLTHGPRPSFPPPPPLSRFPPVRV